MKTIITAIIPTCNRPVFLANRALPSVAKQTRKPDRLIVVDDSDKKLRPVNQEIVATAKIDDCKIVYLNNYRNPGVGGAWNTALAHLLVLTEKKSDTYVALLDDDDEWAPEYLKECERAVLGEKADIAVAGLIRREDCGKKKLAIVKPYTQSLFFEKNPHWQGSNTFAALSAIIRAGAFDENMRSTNDRDLAIRLLDIPSIKWTFINKHLVTHHAENTHDRLSSIGSSRKKEGLQTFYDKYACRMTDKEREANKARARELFGCEIGEAGIVLPGLKTTGEINKGKSAGLKEIVIGAIASPQVDVPLGLLEEIKKLAAQNTGTRIHLLFMPDYSRDSQEWERVQKAMEEAGTKNLTGKHLERTGENADKNGLSIAENRSALQLGCYNYLKNNCAHSEAPVWIIDDDARLSIPVDTGQGVEIRHGLNHIGMIAELKRSRADVVIGSVCGEPPLPFASTIRVQLLDLFYNLCRFDGLARDSPEKLEAPYEFDYGHNQRLRRKYTDFYYDLSRVDSGHLETPFWYEPKDAKITFGEAFKEMVNRLEQLFAGQQVFRQLLWQDVKLVENMLPHFNRGPNTVVFNHEALKIPNLSPKIDGQFTRRSDMNWALLCHFVEGLRVVSAPFPIHQDRTAVKPKPDLDVKNLTNDIRGYAVTSALRKTLISARAINQRKTGDEELILLDYSGDRLNEAKAATEKFLKERLKAFELSYWRIIGLVEALEPYCEPPENAAGKNLKFWHLRPEYKQEAETLTRFWRDIRRVYSERKLNKFLEQAKRLDSREVHAFFRDLRCRMALHRGFV